jgi:hypothetical protein
MKAAHFTTSRGAFERAVDRLHHLRRVRHGKRAQQECVPARPLEHVDGPPATRGVEVRGDQTGGEALSLGGVLEQGFEGPFAQLDADRPRAVGGGI